MNKLVTLSFGRQLLLLALIFLPSTATSAPKSTSSGKKVSWAQIGSELELGKIEIDSGSILFSSEIVFVRAPLEKFRVEVLQASTFDRERASVRTLARLNHAIFAINANFFDENDKPLGLIMSRGALVQRMHRGGNTLTGVLGVSRSGATISGRDGFSPTAVLEAVQAGPRLLAGGKVVTGLRDTSEMSRRAGVCLDGSGRVVFFCVSSGLVGVSFQQLTEVLQQPEVGCMDALNFDGGGSAQLFLGAIPGVALSIEELFIEGRDEVPVAIGLLPK